jgi:hypothetical protein
MTNRWQAQACIHVSTELLRQILLLPDGMEILGAAGSGHYITLWVRGEGCPQGTPEIVPVITPVYRREPDPNVKLLEIRND